MLDKNYDMHDVHTGDVVYTSWGYDETIVDFYQVVRTSAKSFWIKAIASNYIETKKGNIYYHYVTPAKNEFKKDMFHGTKAIRKLKQDFVWMDSDHARGPLNNYRAGQKVWEDRGQY